MFMRMRDENSTTGSLGFRIQGAMLNGQRLSHRYASGRTMADCRQTLRAFLQAASPLQKQSIVTRLQAIHDAASASDWFAQQEVIGSSVLLVYDGKDPHKAGSWMIDFGRTGPAPHRLNHNSKWIQGNYEDGYLFGLGQLIQALTHSSRLCTC